MIEVRLSHGLPLTVAVRTDVGRVRPNNEDSYGLQWLPDGTLLVIVADGMGGHEAGEVASRLAVDTITAELLEQPVPDPRHRLYNAFLAANRAILEEGQRGGKRGMGTTSVVTVVRGREAFVAQVGDSRLLHVRRGHLVWRTLDHTRVQSLVDRGLIREDEARSHSDAGMLTRALGHARMSNGDPLEPEVQREPLRLEEGDTLVLCTDGCHDALEDWEIAMAVAGSSGEEACERLIGMSLDRGGHDNVTVAAVVVGERSLPYDPSVGREGENTEHTDPAHLSPPRPPASNARQRLAARTVAPRDDSEERLSPHADESRRVTAGSWGGGSAGGGAPGAAAPRPTRAPVIAARPPEAQEDGAWEQETPWWFWIAAMAGAALLLLSVVMLATAVWLAV